MLQSVKKIKAIALISSGLDSLLAARIVSDLGIEIHGVCFFFQFDPLAEKIKRGEVEELVRPLSIPLTVVDISEAFLPILLSPEHGYGSGVNPCIDCHLYMLRYAKEKMDAIGARFIVTGEVVGQRPMSQTKPTLFHIEKVSGLKGRILRPLSAKLLPPTVPEEQGWVDRNQLYGFSGRSRKAQLDLVKRLGIRHFNAPAGGCILTEPNYAHRAKALFRHRPKDRISVEDMQLLRFGRHFWPKDHLHIVVGRDEKDNRALEEFQQGRWVFYAKEGEGPLVLVSDVKDESDLAIAAGMTARYCGQNKTSKMRIGYHGLGKREGEVYVRPLLDSVVEAWRV